MSVTITINGDNAQEAGAELQTIARLLSGTAITYRLEEHGEATTQAPAAAKAKPTAKKAPAPEPVVDEELSAEDIELDRTIQTSQKTMRLFHGRYRRNQSTDPSLEI